MKKILLTLLVALPLASIAQTNFSLSILATGHLDNPNDLEDRYTKLEVTGPIGKTVWVDYTTNLKEKTNTIWSKTIHVTIEKNPTSIIISELWMKTNNNQWVNLEPIRIYRLNTYSPK